MSIIETLRAKANSLPEAPGVYIMKDSSEKIIYVGKSKRLKFRVSSYFSQNHTSPKTARMVSLVRDFDYIVCKTEIEALTLENVLIKKHSPKYNIKLKDAKSYPYIKITKDEYPKLIVTRERKSDGGKYFGPYSSASAAYTALETVKKIFSLPTCKRTFPKDIGKERPCIYRDMGRCVAPCVKDAISVEDYNSTVKTAAHVLDGNVSSTLSSLTEEMMRAAEDMNFERAAAYRDSIAALKKLAEKQKVVADAKINRDVFALYTSETEGVLATLTIREGSLVGKNEFMLSSEAPTAPEDVLNLILNYYEGGISIPKEVMIDFKAEDEDTELLSEYLTLVAGKKVTVRTPERGDGRALCDMAYENAKEAARQYRLDGERENKSLSRLATLLGLEFPPERIEAYDISNIGDENIVASMVVCLGGKMKRSEYRTFKIATTDGRDDYASMREAITRRLSHIGDGKASLGERPNLILLDGGEAHVNVIKPILKRMNFDIPVFGMVKDDYHKTRAITDGEREISIATEMNVYAFVYNIQEEAHRFAYLNSQNAKLKSLTRSSLENIKGIGKKKAKLLLSKMSLSDLKIAEYEKLLEIDGISERDAKNVYEYFREIANQE
ncbi:MAG: excinuclease ABC subunit UvrC [Clostridia bacterium]|nr:excinuclease ABC subunit UvrC [Clostridia bacterium]